MLIEFENGGVCSTKGTNVHAVDAALPLLISTCFGLFVGSYLVVSRDETWVNRMRALSLLDVIITVPRETTSAEARAAALAEKGRRNKLGLSHRIPPSRPYITAHDIYAVSVARARAEAQDAMRGGLLKIAVLALLPATLALYPACLTVVSEGMPPRCAWPSVALCLIRATASLIMYISASESFVAWSSAAEAAKSFGGLTKEQWQNGVRTRRLDLCFPENAEAWTAVRAQLVTELPHGGSADLLLAFVSLCWLAHALQLVVCLALRSGSSYRADSVVVVALHTVMLSVYVFPIYLACMRVHAELDEHLSSVGTECARLVAKRECNYTYARNISRSSTKVATSITSTTQMAFAALQYDPRPVNFSATVLPPCVESIVQVVARNSHDVWAYNKVIDGWRHGPKTNPAEKLHQDLVPLDWLGTVPISCCALSLFHADFVLRLFC